MPIALGHPRHGALALVVEQAREAGRREGQRQRRGAAEDRRRGVDRPRRRAGCSGRARPARTPSRDAAQAELGRRRRRRRSRTPPAARAGARSRAGRRCSPRARGAARSGRAPARRGASRGRSSDQRGRRRSVTRREPSRALGSSQARPVSRRPRRRARRAAGGPSTPLRLARRRRRCHASSGRQVAHRLGGEDAPGPGDLGHAAGDVDRRAEPVAAAGRRRPMGHADAHVGEALALLRDALDEPLQAWRSAPAPPARRTSRRRRSS